MEKGYGTGGALNRALLVEDHMVLVQRPVLKQDPGIGVTVVVIRFLQRFSGSA